MEEIPIAEQVGYVILGLGLCGAISEVGSKILGLERWTIGTWANIIFALWYFLLLLVWAVLFGRITLV